MLPANSQHSSECWFWAIPKSIAPTPPRFPMGQFVKLSKYYQHQPNITFYGKVVGVEWDEQFELWTYAIQPPLSHPCAEDIEVLNEAVVEQRLKEDGWELPLVA